MPRGSKLITNRYDYASLKDYVFVTTGLADQIFSNLVGLNRCVKTAGSSPARGRKLPLLILRDVDFALKLLCM